MAVSYIGKGSFQSTTSSSGVTPSLPAGISSGDLLVAVISTPNDSTLYSVDSDWTYLTSIGIGTTGTAGAVDVWVFYARYSGEALGAFGTSETSLKCQQVYAFSGASDPTLSATGNSAGPGSTHVMPAITTTLADTIVFHAIGLDRDAASTTTISSWTNLFFTVTELHDQTVATGVGGGIATAYGVKTTAGSVGNTIAISSVGTWACYATVAIEPASATAYTITADGGTYSYTGTAANTLFNRKVVADAGTYSYTGTAANTLFNRKVVADAGTYSYTGTAANTLFNRLLSADAGTYSYTGTAATLSYQTVTGYTLIADPGTYSYAGTNASILVYRKITAEAGAYAYVGSDITLTYTPAAGFKIFYGTFQVEKIYLGASDVSKAYLGLNEIS